MDERMDQVDRLPRRWWLWPLLLTALAVAILLPVDGRVQHAVRAHPVKGDVRRELEAVQQYGAVASILIGCALIASLDPKRRRRLADWILAAALVALACLLAKMLIGRVRPNAGAGDPWLFLGPFRGRPGTGAGADTFAWQIGARGVSQLWSMPSSHTAAAVAMSLFLGHLYPRLKAFAVVMVVLVGIARVLTDAHYPSDVAVGALVGYLVARPVIAHQAGVRLLARMRARRSDE
jgi:membrane-associated phospholipid phosphatase